MCIEHLRGEDTDLAFTKYSLVYSEVVHWSILYLAFNTSCIVPPLLYIAIDIAQYMVSPRLSCFAIQHTILRMTISCTGQIGMRISE